MSSSICSSSVSVKLSPPIPDFTVGFTDVEEVETVLYEQSPELREVFSVEDQSPEDSEESPVEPQAIPAEQPADLKIFVLAEKEKWEELMEVIEAQPTLASLMLTGVSDSEGNLVLHEVCKHRPSLDVIDCLLNANRAAAGMRGHFGCLPLHNACAFGASAAVIQRLVDICPGSVRVLDGNDQMLPLHHACNSGAPEAVLMILLTAYPEATLVHDVFGRYPGDYAKGILNESRRKAAIVTLENAPIFVAVSKATTLRLEQEHKKRVAGMKEGFSTHVNAIREEHENEKSLLEKQLEDSKSSEEKLELELTTQKVKYVALHTAMASQDRTLKGYLESQKKKIQKIEEEKRRQAIVYEAKIQELELEAEEMKQLKKKLASTQWELDISKQQITPNLRRHTPKFLKMNIHVFQFLLVLAFL